MLAEAKLTWNWNLPMPKLTLIIFLLIPWISCANNFAHTHRVPDSCINDLKPPPEQKSFYYEGNYEQIRILTSSRLTHKLVSKIFQIFTQQVVGYTNVSIVEIDDPRLSFEPDVQLANISSCEKNDCSDLYGENKDAEPVPHAMINLETWLPANYQVEGWQVKDLGPLGAGGRFGWYIPEVFATKSPPIKDHWRAFTNPKVTSMFTSSKDEEFIKKHTKREDGSFYCHQESLCEEEGMIIPKNCKHRQRHGHANNCALMISDFPVDSSFYSSKFLKRQIEELNLLVKVVFVGDNFAKVVNYLENQSEAVQSGNHSYLLFHYSPSLITHKYNYTTVKFDPCEEQWTQEISDYSNDSDLNLNCLYSHNKFSKVIWPKLYERARPIYEALKKVEFSQETYNKLLGRYEQRLNQAIADQSSNSQNLDAKTFEAQILHDVACEWLNQNDTNYQMPRKNYEKWRPSDKKRLLNLASFFPLTGEKYTAVELLPVLNMALDDINDNKSGLLTNYKLTAKIMDGECKPSTVMKKFIDIIMNDKVMRDFIGILGPACSDTIEPIAGLSKHINSVVITYSAEGSSAETEKNSNLYKYFFRTIAENRQYKYAYMEIFKKLEWKHVASLSQSGNKYSEYINTLQDFLSKSENGGMTFIANRKFDPSKNMKKYLTELKESGARIIIGDFFKNAAQKVMCEAYKLHMTQKEGYVWFLPGWYHPDWYKLDDLRELEAKKNNSEKNDQKESIPDCSTDEMIQALQGHLSLMHANYANEEHRMQTNITVKEWKEKLAKRLKIGPHAEYLKRVYPSTYNPDHPSKYSGYVYDAVWLFAKALDELIRENESYIEDIRSTRFFNKFSEVIKKTDFNGVSGRINFNNDRNSRLSNIQVIQWRSENESKVIGSYEPKYEKNDKGHLAEWDSIEIKWYTANGQQPADRLRECAILTDFANAMDLKCENAISLAFVAGFGSLFILVLLIFVILKRRYDAKMAQTEARMRALGLLTPSCVLTLDEWEIPRDRVVINRKLGEGAFGTVYGGEAFFDEKGWSKLERLWSVPSFKDIAMRTDLLDSNYLHKDGVLRVAVAVKTLKTGSTVEEKLDFLGEADMMKRFDHKNIVKLLGVCTRNEPIYTVMEFMLYGDLKTYLLARRHLVNERNREELDEVSNRRLTNMAIDISKGLSYLAELKYVHRDIACRNCLVNSTRVVKLADFGMTRPMYENDYYRFSRKGMLPVRWMAPESLADGLFTPMSDIWSYGVLLYEMITFGSFPFQGLSNNQVMEHVKAGHTLSIPSGIKPQLETLLKSCWNMTATKRPTASEIVELLSNSPRLISPCIDVPLASVQVERTDSLELIPSVRKPSGSVSQVNKPGVVSGRSGRTERLRGDGASDRPNTVTENSFGSNVSGPYSPMSGVPCGNGILLNGLNGGPGGSPSTSSNPFKFMDMSREPLLPSSQLCRNATPPPVGSRDPSFRDGGSKGGSYVPPGYILVDHTSSSNKSNPGTRVTSPELITNGRGPQPTPV